MLTKAGLSPLSSFVSTLGSDWPTPARIALAMWCRSTGESERVTQVTIYTGRVDLVSTPPVTRYEEI